MVWNGIREVISGKSHSKNDVPKLLIDKNNQYDKDLDIANTFNNLYGSVANKTKSKIVPTNTKFDSFLKTKTQIQCFYNQLIQKKFSN